jgi:hypothetical protein
MGKYLDILSRAESYDKNDINDQTPPNSCTAQGATTCRIPLVVYVVSVVLSPLSKLAARITSQSTAGKRLLQMGNTSSPAGAPKPRPSAGPPATCSASTCRQRDRARPHNKRRTMVAP